MAYVYIKRLLQDSDLNEKDYKIFSNQILYQIFDGPYNKLNGVLVIHCNGETKEEIKKIKKTLEGYIPKKLDEKDFKEAKLEVVDFIKSLINVNSLYLKEKKVFENMPEKAKENSLQKFRQNLKSLKAKLKCIIDINYNRISIFLKNKKGSDYLKFLEDVEEIKFDSDKKSDSLTGFFLKMVLKDRYKKLLGGF